MSNSIRIILHMHPFVVRLGPNQGQVRYRVKRAGGFSQVVDDERLSARVEHATTLTGTDVLATIHAVKREIVLVLAEGNRVRLSGFGTFFLGLNVQTHDNPDDVSTNDVMRIRMRFLPAPNMRFENALHAYTRGDTAISFELRRFDGDTELNSDLPPEPDNGEDNGDIIDPDA